VNLVFSTATAEGASDTQRIVRGENKEENQAHWRKQIYTWLYFLAKKCLNRLMMIVVMLSSLLLLSLHPYRYCIKQTF